MNPTFVKDFTVVICKYSELLLNILHNDLVVHWGCQNWMYCCLSIIYLHPVVCTSGKSTLQPIWLIQKHWESIAWHNTSEYGKTVVGNITYNRQVHVVCNRYLLHFSNWESQMWWYPAIWEYYMDGLVQERRYSSALAMELHLSCINPYGTYLKHQFSIKCHFANVCNAMVDIKQAYDHLISAVGFPMLKIYLILNQDPGTF